MNSLNKSKGPNVGILLGSDSDLKYLKDGVEVFEKLGISYEIKIASAHRTPEKVFEYAKSAESRGIEVIIAGAGGAAHLPGVVAALTNLPVIGIPITSSLSGLDSLLSIVQMPGGVPVATVGINNSKNAAILAARILSLKYPEIKTKLEEYVSKMKQDVEQKSKELDEIGFQKYLEKLEGKK
jgi:5-(carboxyamino)imidazole ribonucleotide mutase